MERKAALVHRAAAASPVPTAAPPATGASSCHCSNIPYTDAGSLLQVSGSGRTCRRRRLSIARPRPAPSRRQRLRQQARAVAIAPIFRTRTRALFCKYPGRAGLAEDRERAHRCVEGRRVRSGIWLRLDRERREVAMSEGDAAIARVMVEGRTFAKPGGENLRRARGMLLWAFAGNRWPGKALFAGRAPPAGPPGCGGALGCAAPGLPDPGPGPR